MKGGGSNTGNEIDLAVVWKCLPCRIIYVKVKSIFKSAQNDILKSHPSKGTASRRMAVGEVTSQQDFNVLQTLGVIVGRVQ